MTLLLGPLAMMTECSALRSHRLRRRRRRFAGRGHLVSPEEIFIEEELQGTYGLFVVSHKCAGDYGTNGRDEVRADGGSVAYF